LKQKLWWQAHLGGTPSRKGQVQAYLRLREHDQGPLDFDTPGGVDTTWHRIYLCLRSAFYLEAIEVLHFLPVMEALCVGHGFAKDYSTGDAVTGILCLMQDCKRTVITGH